MFTCLPGPPEIEAIALGAGGLQHGLQPGAIYVDLSSSSPTLIRTIAGRLADSLGLNLKVSVKWGQLHNPGIVVYSKQLFDNLSPAEQAALRDCTQGARDEQHRLNRSVAEQWIARLKAKGMIVNELSAAELAWMREVAKPIHEKAIPTIGSDMMTAVNEDLKRVRGR